MVTPPPGFRYIRKNYRAFEKPLSHYRKINWFDFSAPAIAWGGFACGAWFIVSYVQRGGVVVVNEGLYIWVLVFFLYTAWKMLSKIWSGR